MGVRQVYKELVPLYFPPPDEAEESEQAADPAEPEAEGQRMFKGSDGLPVIVSGEGC